MSKMGAARTTKRATSSAALAVILVVMVLAGAASVYLIERGGGGPQPSRTYTVASSATSTSARSAGNGLELTLTLNSSDFPAGQGVAVTVDEVNVMATPNNVSASSDWPVQGLAVGPCGPLNYPVGVEVLSGNYDASNVSSGTALQVYRPGLTTCPMMLSGIGGYLFQASSDNATIFGSCQPSGGGCLTEEVSPKVSFSGYYSGNEFASFPIGIYTVVAGDEWGELAILHFAVTGTGG
jgi:hypothetical protein